MFTPTSDTATSRPDLGQAVYETMQSAPTMGYIGLQVLPIFRVSEYTATYPVIPKEALFNLLDTSRANLGHYNRSADEFEEGFYRTSENGLERRIDERFAKIYGNKFNYELVIANILMNNILRAQEQRIASKLFNETNFTATAADTAWSDTGNADPKADVKAGKIALRENGVVANALVFNYSTFLNLAECGAIQEQVYQLFPDAAKSGQVTVEHLKTYFDVEQILVAGSLKNTSKSGQDASLSDIWSSDYAMLAKVAAGDITEPSIGRCMLWNEGAQEEVIVEEYYSNEVRSDILRVRHDTAETFLSSFDADGTVKSEISKACGYLIDVTAGA